MQKNDGILSVEEIDNLLSALSSGANDEIKRKKMRVGDNNFENVEEIKGTLSADLAKIIEAPLPAKYSKNFGK